MEINQWWAGRPEERFWMEITDRDDVGVDLRAPQLNGAGNEEWSYALVSYVEPGDVVLHWHKTWSGEASLIGWSEVVGPLYEDSMEWLARGTRGRLRGKAARVPNWVTALGGLNEFEKPILRSDLNAHQASVLDAISDLRAAERGPIYQPFYLYGKTQLRAMQSYLTKFPAALVPLVENLTGEIIGTPLVERPAGPTRMSPVARKGARAPRQGQGYLQDPVLRKLIEDYAVDRAVAHYRAAGATKIKALGKPYDLQI